MTMKFDHSLEQHTDGLPAHMIPRIKQVWQQNRKNGFNLQYVMEDGRIDERSCNSREQAERFAASLSHNNYAFSA